MMKHKFLKAFLMLVLVAAAVSCASHKRKPGRVGDVIVIGRNAEGRGDNGLHKGWYKNPNNPHHPFTTNPGHTKGKRKHGKGHKD